MLHANRGKLDASEIRGLLEQVTEIAKDQTEDEALAALSVRTIGNLILTLEESGQVSSVEARKQAAFLMASATNTRRSVDFRTNAITVLGILNIREASPLLHDALGEIDGMNVPEIARATCLSLVQIDGELAVPALAKVLRTTKDSRVFGTAAFAIGQVKKADSMIALVEN